MCVKNPDPTPTPSNTVLPGDICSKDADCYNNAGGAACTGGKCVAKVKVGDSCDDGTGNADTKRCPENSYCDATKKCVNTVASGQACTKATPCSSGLACIGNKDGTAYT